MSEILREIGVISRALSFISNIEFKELHLNKGQYLYMARICEHPGIINDTLAELLKKDRTTVAKSVSKLEKDGLIRKEIDPANKKIRCLYPTAKGQELYCQLELEEKYSEAQALAGLSAQEREQLQQLLKKVRQNVEQDWSLVKNGGKRQY